MRGKRIFACFAAVALMAGPLAACKEEKPEPSEEEIRVEVTVPSDSEKPIIRMADGNAQTLEGAAVQKIPAFTVSDDVDVNLNVRMRLTDPDGAYVPTQGMTFVADRTGDYTLTLNACDSSGKAADEVTAILTVVDTQAPAVNLRGLEVAPVKVVAKNYYRIPTPIVYDFSGYELRVDITDPDGAVTEDFDLYQKYLPMKSGEYTVKYTATERGNPERFTVKTLRLAATEMGMVNAFENISDVNTWEKGGGLNPSAYPALSLSAEHVTQGSYSMKAVYSGVAGATKEDRPGIYMYFNYADIMDVSLLSSVAIDVYNANPVAAEFELVLMAAENKSYRAPRVSVAPNAGTTLYLDLTAAGREVDTTNVMSLILSVDGVSEGQMTYYYDNFRVIP